VRKVSAYFVVVLIALGWCFAGVTEGSVIYTSQSRFVEARNDSTGMPPRRIEAPDFDSFNQTARLQTPTTFPQPWLLAEASMNSTITPEGINTSGRAIAQWLTPLIPIGGASSNSGLDVSFSLDTPTDFRLYYFFQQLLSGPTQSSGGCTLYRDGLPLYRVQIDFQNELFGTLTPGDYRLVLAASAITSVNASRSGEFVYTGGIQIPATPAGAAVAGGVMFAALRRARRGA